ncbi:MAG: bifunctional hydroxymethylpyrimidine kinase/phosphomethylpyrimidine kinase, partial [Oscillospiraceae bacterium]|nr:bifunctional hydroxymethylpyrimidine kinase/phosphomethylpyrimidine kinase [Oscillospiraceae bacterium]
MIKKILTIAGSDSSGGAGIQADIKTFSALGTYGLSVITAVTAQNTKEITDICNIPPESVKAQLDAVFSDIKINAVKIGMLPGCDTINVVCDALKKYSPPFVVFDPVAMSTSGTPLTDPDATDCVRSELLPLCSVVTPNIPEAEMLADMRILSEDDIEKALYSINRYVKNVLIKGGHADGAPIDTLLYDNEIYRFTGKRVNTKNTHGTGCTLS